MSHTPSNSGMGEPQYEHDVEGRSLVTMLGTMGVLTAVFFSTIGALFIYFRWEADQELSRKIEQYESPELAGLRAREAKELGNIGDAMRSTVQSVGATMPKVEAPPAPPAPEPPPPPPAPEHGAAPEGHH